MASNAGHRVLAGAVGLGGQRSQLVLGELADDGAELLLLGGERHRLHASSLLRAVPSLTRPLRRSTRPCGAPAAGSGQPIAHSGAVSAWTGTGCGPVQLGAASVGRQPQVKRAGDSCSSDTPSAVTSCRQACPRDEAGEAAGQGRRGLDAVAALAGQPEQAGPARVLTDDGHPVGRERPQAGPAADDRPQAERRRLVHPLDAEGDVRLVSAGRRTAGSASRRPARRGRSGPPA